MNPDETRSLIAESLGIDVTRVGDDLAFGSIPEWDSIHHVNLMLALESAIDTQIGPDEMVELVSAGAIVEFARASGRGS